MDDAEIVRIMGEQHAEVIKAIGEVREDFAAPIAALGVKVDALEKDADRNFWSDKLEKYLPAPILVGMHILAHKLGWKV